MTEYIIEAETLDDYVEGRYTLECEVVRCKDCRHNIQRYVKGVPVGGKDFAQCTLDALIRDNDFFCSQGRRGRV